MNKKIVIDPGHGGSDPGAVGNGITEKDYTLKISKYMADRLRQLGADVTLTRDSDLTLDPNTRVKRVLDSYGNSNDVLVISNHINAGGGDGAEVIYALRNTNELPNQILENLKKQGQNSRKAYQRPLPSNPSKDYYFMLRNTGNTDAYIVEYGFLDSKQDDVSQLKNNWQQYAEAVVEAISTYLNLPYSNQSVDNYIVKSGDTLWSIAKRFNTTVNDIKQRNNLSTNLLKVGSNLQIPKTNNEIINSYEVQIGDTLYSLARRFNTTVDEIKNLNKLTNDILSVNQILNIPTISNGKQKYIVKSGDTLYGIARMLGISVSELQQLNNLSNSILSIGQQLIIP